jgi:hypothetical protein
MPKTTYRRDLKFIATGRNEIPLHSLDQHTRIGKTALYRASSRLNIPFAKIAWLWFVKVSALVSSSIKEEFWWPLIAQKTSGAFSDRRWTEIQKVVVEEIRRKAREEGLQIRKN